MAGRDEHSENLKRQIERTRGTYLMMRDSGYEKDTPVRLRFAYRRSPRESAESLVAYLEGKTRYAVKMEEDEDGWIVHGTTNPSKLNAASLGRWVYWMYSAGYQFDCVFDGWGARI